MSDSNQTSEPVAEVASRQAPIPTRRSSRRRVIGFVLLGLVIMAAIGSWRYVALRWEQRRAEQLLARRQNLEAALVLQRALRYNLQDVRTIQYLARAQRRLGHIDTMTLLLDRARELGGDAAWIERERRLALAQTGHIQETEPYLADMLIHAGADGPDICEAYVQGYFANLLSGPALRLLDAWQKSFPADPQPWFMRAYFWQTMNEPAKAIKFYRKALSLAPDKTAIRCGLAKALIDTDQLDQAESELAVCSRRSPQDPEVHYLMARCAFARGKLDEAMRQLKKTLALAPDHVDAHRLKGQIELANGKTQQAVKELQSVLRVRPYDTWAHEALGRALRALGRDQEADEHFKYVAEAEKSVGRLDRLIRQAFAKPDDADLRFQIGQILFQYGPPEDAARWMRAALELNPNHAGAHRALAAYYQQIGDVANASKHRQWQARTK